MRTCNDDEEDDGDDDEDEVGLDAATKRGGLDSTRNHCKRTERTIGTLSGEHASMVYGLNDGTMTRNEAIDRSEEVKRGRRVRRAGLDRAQARIKRKGKSGRKAASARISPAVTMTNKEEEEIKCEVRGMNRWSKGK